MNAQSTVLYSCPVFALMFYHFGGLQIWRTRIIYVVFFNRRNISVILSSGLPLCHTVCMCLTKAEMTGYNESILHDIESAIQYSDDNDLAVNEMGLYYLSCKQYTKVNNDMILTRGPRISRSPVLTSVYARTP